MATVTVRKLDPEVVDRLKHRARNHNRSLEAELREILTREAEQPPRSVDLKRLALEIAAKTPPGPRVDSVELLREDRNR